MIYMYLSKDPDIYQEALDALNLSEYSDLFLIGKETLKLKFTPLDFFYPQKFKKLNLKKQQTLFNKNKPGCCSNFFCPTVDQKKKFWIAEAPYGKGFDKDEEENLKDFLNRRYKT